MRKKLVLEKLPNFSEVVGMHILSEIIRSKAIWRQSSQTWNAAGEPLAGNRPHASAARRCPSATFHLNSIPRQPRLSIRMGR